MASLDKHSVRLEVNRLKADFDTLCVAGKVSDEMRAIVSSLLMVVDLILAIFLEKQTRKHSKNSSIPPSQSDPDETSTAQSGSNGKGKKVNDTLADNTRTRTTVSIAKVDTCPTCGESLDAIRCAHYERRTKIDIVFEKVEEHVDAEVKQCPTCETTVKGSFPVNMPGPLQYGDGLKAFVINLLVCQMVALNRVRKLVASMIGTLLSEATLLKFVLRLHLALANWETQTNEQLLKEPVIHVDETALRVDKKNHWIHVYSSGGLTMKWLHRKRGLEAIEALGIIPRYGGIIIHDCWASYLSYDHCGHGLCGSHLLRELTFIIESNDYAWARHMKRLLQKTCKKVADSEDKRLTDQEFANVQKRYRTILTPLCQDRCRLYLKLFV